MTPTKIRAVLYPYVGSERVATRHPLKIMPQGQKGYFEARPVSLLLNWVVFVLFVLDLPKHFLYYFLPALQQKKKIWHMYCTSSLFFFVPGGGHWILFKKSHDVDDGELLLLMLLLMFLVSRQNIFYLLFNLSTTC